MLGVLIVPAIGWAITVSWMLMASRSRQAECLSCHAEMINMHKNADKYGFGTVELRAMESRNQTLLENLIKDNTRALREVSHYIRWSIENATGQKPPPPMPVEAV